MSDDHKIGAIAMLCMTVVLLGVMITATKCNADDQNRYRQCFQDLEACRKLCR